MSRGVKKRCARFVESVFCMKTTAGSTEEGSERTKGHNQRLHLVFQGGLNSSAGVQKTDILISNLSLLSSGPASCVENRTRKN